MISGLGDDSNFTRDRALRGRFVGILRTQAEDLIYPQFSYTPPNINERSSNAVSGLHHIHRISR